jgi:ATP-dependent DNA ligase
MARSTVKPATDAETDPLRFIEPMEARLVDELPAEPGWRFEPKWDGFRCLACRSGDDVRLYAKSGKPLARYFPDVAELVLSLAARQIILDGELVIPIGDTLSFDALQLRLHPAESRVKKLAAETPALIVAFDMLLAPDGQSLLDRPLEERRQHLERFHSSARNSSLRISPYTDDVREARRWLETSGGDVDGVVAKRAEGPYQPGERAMLKVKRLSTADCVVGGFRYGSGTREVGSLLLGLYDEAGLLHHVGFTSTIHGKDRAVLTRKLEALRKPPGFTGRAPGGPSRWATERTGEWEPLEPSLVVEVRYDHVTGDRFRHGTKMMRWRPDKAPRQCTFDQLSPAAPGVLLSDLRAK